MIKIDKYHREKINLIDTELCNLREYLIDLELEGHELSEEQQCLVLSMEEVQDRITGVQEEQGWLKD